MQPNVINYLHTYQNKGKKYKRMRPISHSVSNMTNIFSPISIFIIENDYHVPISNGIVFVIFLFNNPSRSNIYSICKILHAGGFHWLASYLFRPFKTISTKSSTVKFWRKGDTLFVWNSVLSNLFKVFAWHPIFRFKSKSVFSAQNADVLSEWWSGWKVVVTHLYTVKNTLVYTNVKSYSTMVAIKSTNSLAVNGGKVHTKTNTQLSFTYCILLF